MEETSLILSLLYVEDGQVYKNIDSSISEIPCSLLLFSLLIFGHLNGRSYSFTLVSLSVRTFVFRRIGSKDLSVFLYEVRDQENQATYENRLFGKNLFVFSVQRVNSKAKIRKWGFPNFDKNLSYWLVLFCMKWWN